MQTLEARKWIKEMVFVDLSPTDGKCVYCKSSNGFLHQVIFNIHGWYCQNCKKSSLDKRRIPF